MSPQQISARPPSSSPKTSSLTCTSNGPRPDVSCLPQLIWQRKRAASAEFLPAVPSVQPESFPLSLCEMTHVFFTRSPTKRASPPSRAAGFGGGGVYSSDVMNKLLFCPAGTFPACLGPGTNRGSPADDTPANAPFTEADLREKD